MLDAFQQTLDAVMKKTGDVKDGEDEAEKLLETMNGNKSELTRILLESPVNVEQDVEQQVVDFGNFDPVGFHWCNVCHMGCNTNEQMRAHMHGASHKTKAHLHWNAQLEN